MSEHAAMVSSSGSKNERERVHILTMLQANMMSELFTISPSEAVMATALTRTLAQDLHTLILLCLLYALEFKHMQTHSPTHLFHYL